MRTSKTTLVRDAALVAALATGLIMLLSPSDVSCAALAPHPVWLGILTLAAWHGLRGFAVALPLGWGVFALALAGLGAPLGPLGARLDSASAVGALLACVVVGWVSSAHERRKA